MGGGGSYSSDSGYGGEISGTNFCGGSYKIQVIFIQGENEIENVLKKCAKKDLVKINLQEGNLPSLEVRRVSDDLLVGYVPPSLSRLIKCIREEGWEYSGEIINISGNKYNPDILIEVEGVL